MDPSHNDTSWTQRAVKGISWSGTSLVVRTLLNLAVVAVLARLLSPHEYGVVGAAMIVVGAGNTIANLGMSQVIIQRKDLDEKHRATAAFMTIAIAVTLGLLQWLSADAIAAFLRVPELSEVSRVFSVVMLSNALVLLADAALSRHLQFKISALVRLAVWLAAHCGLAITLALLGFGYWALVIAFVAESILLAVIYLWFARHYLSRPRFDVQAFRDIRRQSAGFSLGELTAFFSQNIDNMFVAHFMGKAALGIYTRAYYIVAMPANLFGNLGRSVIFPLMSKIQDDRRRLQAAQLKGYALAAAVSFPVSAFICCFAKEFVETLLGPNWLSAVGPITFFAAVIYFRVGYKVSGSAMLAIGRSYTMAAMQVAYTCLVAAASFFSVGYGVDAVAFAVSLAIVASFFIYAFVSCHATGLSLSDLFRAHLAPLCFAAAIYLVGATLKHFLYALPSPILLLVAGSIIGAASLIAIYFRASLLFGRHGLEVVRSISSKQLARLQWKPT